MPLTHVGFDEKFDFRGESRKVLARVANGQRRSVRDRSASLHDSLDTPSGADRQVNVVDAGVELNTDVPHEVVVKMSASSTGAGCLLNPATTPLREIKHLCAGAAGKQR